MATKIERLQANAEQAKLRLTIAEYLSAMGAATFEAGLAGRKRDEAAFREALGHAQAAIERAFAELPERAT